MENIIIDVDSYKASHYLQYPPNTTSMFSYIESRGGPYDQVMFFGLQYILKRYLSHRVTVDEVNEAKEFFEAHGEPFNYDGWMYIATELKGKLPIRIRAAKEGSLIPTHNILVSVESTDPKVFWIVSWLETMLLRVWYPITVATTSYHIKKLITSYLEKTSDSTDEIDFKLHDFGSRGVSSQESAMIGGAAHIVNFKGSDTVVAVRCVSKYYNAPISAFSIPAGEHSSITSWGRENEALAYENMVKQFSKPNSIYAVVSDSYNIKNACEHIWGEQLKDLVISSGGTLVVRPDSGNPKDIVLMVTESLASKFGYTVNSKGFKVLNHVRVIQGDGINYSSIKEILDNLTEHGYSASNVAFGMGGALLQAPNRDLLSFAMKCSSVTVDGVDRDVYKDPVTDSGKKSKRGRLDLVKRDGKYSTVVLPSGVNSFEYSELQTVYLDGELLIDTDFESVRKQSSL